MVRKVLFLLLFSAFVLLLAVPVFAQQQPYAAPANWAVFTVGDCRYYCAPVGMEMQEYQADVAPFIENGRCFVPVRYLAYALGVAEKDIQWDAGTKTVALILSGTTVKLTVGSMVLYVNGEPMKMDMAPVITEGRVCLPSRWVAKAFGYEVGWNATNRAVLVGLPGRIPAPPALGTGEAPSAPAVKVVPAAVTEVVDGDTAYMNISGTVEKVRFIGVDTPETKHPTVGEEPYGKEASAFTARSLTGRKVYLELDVQERDKYGRLLAYVWLEPPTNNSEAEVRSKMFNAKLLLEGYAQVMTVPPNVKYADMFVKFQQEAREAGKGLWGIPAPAGGTSTDKEGYYIGNARSKKFHCSDCVWAQKISPENRVYFKTREEAIRQGYESCKVCEP